MAKFSELLKKYRKDRNVTQDALARLTGMATSTISKLESADNDMEPGWRTVQKICAVLDLDVRDFVEEEVMYEAQLRAKMMTQAWAPLPSTELAEPLPEKSKKKPTKKGSRQ